MAIRHATAIFRTDPAGTKGQSLLALLTLLAAVPVAFLIAYMHQSFPERPERAVQGIVGLFALLVALPSTAYFFRPQRVPEPRQLGLIVLAAVSVLLVASYLYWVSHQVFFPADVLIWSESEFVNDILKLHLGYPLYSAQANNESFIYTPGTQMLSYLIARLFGNAMSIPLYRGIQLGYTVLAAVVAFCCCRNLVAMHPPARWLHDSRLWGIVWLPMLFLTATNPLTNPYIHNLHNDALAQLVSIIAYWLLLQYAASSDKRLLALMVVMPAIGFLVKQSLAIWVLLYCIYLGFFDGSRSLARVITFALAALGGIGIVLGSCYLLWGEHFVYWVFTVAGKHPRDPLRSLQHLLDGWLYCTLGLLGGLVFLRRQDGRRFLGVWLIWLCLFLTEAGTSGIGWMRNHLGPGCLIASVWFLIALARLWPSNHASKIPQLWSYAWLRTGITVAMVCFVLNGLGSIRIPVPSLPQDAYRYARAIEQEFVGQKAADILLDAGTWLYLKDGIIMKDRVISIGDRGYGEVGDFSGILQRLKQKRYTKILVRNFHSSDFWYDHWMWRTSSGIKQTLQENYHEVSRIEAVAGDRSQKDPRYLFQDISILVPKSN